MGDKGEMWGTLGPLGVETDDLSMVCVGAGGNADAYIDCNASLVCMDKTSGSVEWESSAGKQIQSRPSQGRSNLFVGDYGIALGIDGSCRTYSNPDPNSNPNPHSRRLRVRV